MTEPLTIAESAKLRAYGYHFESRPEDPTKCAAQTNPVDRGDRPWQCSRPRGHGAGGLLCKQHAAKRFAFANIPPVGSWGRYLLKGLEYERAPLLAAVKKLAEVEAKIAAIQGALDAD